MVFEWTLPSKPLLIYTGYTWVGAWNPKPLVHDTTYTKCTVKQKHNVEIKEKS